ncbi:SixA phosphatase family protein [Pseudochrobactrum sp. MP213Fo]|uniref:SixA phosphatase family protein n=1 Tax=Pseudochrobactrum sp. MP213Fo TaxID=3022250 RepID=UPI003BA0EA6B
MRTILLLRHAQAVLPDSSGKDFDRRLSLSGENDAEMQAIRIVQSGLKPDFIVYSPACRTYQTAHIFAATLNKAFPEAPVTLQAAAALYRADAAGYIDEIRSSVPDTAQCVLIVGHNPSIEDCALLFAQENQRLAERIGYGFPTSGVAVIVTDKALSELAPNTGTLTALLLPHED